jgi:hypothetical protein
MNHGDSNGSLNASAQFPPGANVPIAERVLVFVQSQR